MSRSIHSFDEFWPYYLREHAKPATRAWHYAGTALGILMLVLALVLGELWFLLAALVAGYGPAWVGHFFIEKNRPATFTYPLWSLLSDCKMFWCWISGKLDAELKRAEVE